MKTTYLFLLAFLVISCNKSALDEIQPATAASGHANYFEPGKDYEFVSRTNHDTNEAVKIKLRLDEHGIMQYSYSTIIAESGMFSRTSVFAPIGEVKTGACSNPVMVHYELKVMTDPSSYWIIPFNNPSEFMQMPGSILDLHCDCTENCDVVFRGQGSAISLVCSNATGEPCGMMAISFEGEKLIKGPILLVKANGVLVR